MTFNKLILILPLFGIYILLNLCVRNTRLVSSSEQVVSHLVQIGCFASVDEEHHLFKDLSFHVVYLHSVLGRKSQQNLVNLTVSENIRSENPLDFCRSTD